MPQYKVTKSITEENQYSDWVELKGLFNLSISGTWVATVTVQRSFDAGSTPLDVDTFTINEETYGTETEDGVVYRVGVKTGDFTSGTVVCRISQ